MEAVCYFIGIYISTLDYFIKNVINILITCSFPRCYQAQFGEQLVIDHNRGVPLEHLISSIRSVVIKNLLNPRARKVIIANSSTSTIEGV